MTTPDQEKGVMAALMERFETQRLPRALALNRTLNFPSTPPATER